MLECSISELAWECYVECKGPRSFHDVTMLRPKNSRRFKDLTMRDGEMLAAKQEIKRIIRTKSWSLNICVSLGNSRSRGNPHKCGSLDNPGIRLADGFISVGCPSNLSFTHIILKTSKSLKAFICP